MAKSFSNLYTYIVIMFIVSICIGIIQTVSVYKLSHSSNLDNETTQYLGQMIGIDLSEFNVTASEIEDNSADLTTNDTGTQQKDFALEYFYAKSTMGKLGNVAKQIYRLPEYILIFFKIPISNVEWLISIINWFYRTALIFAVYLAIRGVWT